MTTGQKPLHGASRIAAIARQEQFLEVVDRDEALARFLASVPPRRLGSETLPLLSALGRVLAADFAAPADAPPFDRANVDGFALRAQDTANASEAQPIRLRINADLLTCGSVPTTEIETATATVIATGAMLPRGADAVVLVEETEIDEIASDGPYVVITRPAMAGQFIGSAGSDIARGETLLRAGTKIGAREIAQLAAVGLNIVRVFRRPRVAVISTGDELVAPGGPLRAGGIYDANGAAITAAAIENGAEATFRGIVRDDVDSLAAAMSRALFDADMVVLSGGTSKGAGDLSTRVIARFGKPGILVHGVAVKPGKPICLAKVYGKPLVVLPGFPTSAMFTFNAFAVPVIRAMAGLAPKSDAVVDAMLPTRVSSERGRTEFIMVSLVKGRDGLVAVPTAKGSGTVTAFAQADGYIEVPALTDSVDAGSPVRVQLLGPHVAAPDLVIAGSHCLGLDVIAGALAPEQLRVRTLSVGSSAGLAAARRGECDIAPVHLFDPSTQTYNAPFLTPGLSLVPGWRRMQGVVFRPGDDRFEGLGAQSALERALGDPSLVMVNRNVGSGTRALVDRALGAARPKGWWNQPKSHNAVAAAVHRGSADWGISIATVANLYGLGFLPLAEEHYDFILVDARRERPGVRAFFEALGDPAARERLKALQLYPG